MICPNYPAPDPLPYPPVLTAVDVDAIAAATEPYKVPDAVPKRIKPFWDIVGGVSNPSKMPCKSYSIPAQTCPMGRYMVGNPKTVCSGCYVLSGSNYRRFNVRVSQWRRFERLALPEWVDAMVETVGHYSNGWFRFHDSGDILGLWHLQKIVSVCEQLPSTRFWLPTREYKTVRQWLADVGPFPKNLTVRTSALFVDQPAQKIGNLPASTVSTDKPIGRQCIAYTQDGNCLDCRFCWDKRVRVVSYPKH